MSREKTLYQETIVDFFHPRFEPEKRVRPPEFMNEIAVRSLLGGDGGKSAPAALKAVICDAAEAKLYGQVSNSANWSHGRWEEADAVCASALELYLALEDAEQRHNVGKKPWWERDADKLAYLIELYWKMPDRDLDTGEEKTNCTTYLIDRPCMLKTKKALFSQIIRFWCLEAFPKREYRSANAHAALAFLKEVFGQDTGDRETTPRNAAKLREVESFPSTRRRFHRDEKKLLLGLLERHCEGAKLEDIKPWLSDDLPEEFIKIFQDVLIKTGDPKVALKLLRAA